LHGKESEWLQNRGSKFDAPTAIMFSGNRKRFNQPIAGSAVLTFIWKRVILRVLGTNPPFTGTKSPKDGLMSHALHAPIINRSRCPQNQLIVASAADTSNWTRVQSPQSRMNRVSVFCRVCKNFRIYSGSSEPSSLGALNALVSVRFPRRRLPHFAQNAEPILICRITRSPALIRGQFEQVGGLRSRSKETLSVAVPTAVRPRSKDLCVRN